MTKLPPMSMQILLQELALQPLRCLIKSVTLQSGPFHSHGRRGSLNGLENLLDCSLVLPALMQSEIVVDAGFCFLAAADFICGRAKPPVDHNTALIEGWIWTSIQVQ